MCTWLSTDFQSSFILTRVDKVVPLLDSLSDLEDTQVEFGILRACLSFGKVGYLLRTVEPGNTLDCFVRFDHHIRLTLENILSHAINDFQWRFACFPVRLGGLGIRRAADVQDAAYIGSRLKTAGPVS